MDCTSTAAPAGSILHCALELSKNTWLLGIQFPDRPQPSLYPIKGGNTEDLMSKLTAARDRRAKLSGRAPSIVLCYEAGYDAGNVSPQKFGGYKGYALEPYRRQIERWVDAQPDLTLAELQARLAERDVVVSQTAIFRFLRHLDFTLKKKPTRCRTRPVGRGRST